MGIDLKLGDCWRVLADLADGAVDVTLTDPPYDERTHAGAQTRTTGASGKTLVTFASLDDATFVTLAHELVRVTRRWVIMTCAWQHAALLARDPVLVRLGVWIKPNGAPQLSGDRPAQGWEAVAILHRRGKKRWNGGGGRAVWTCNHVEAKEHPTQKPVPLLCKLLEQFSDPGELVFDPMMGSGSTGVACAKLGRGFLGVERDKTYLDAAARRIGHAVKTRGFVFGKGAK